MTHRYCVPTVVFISMALFGTSLADIYLHNPRGSNDRLFTASTTRQNAERLFDSQNNAKGGYNVGETGSEQAKNESQLYKMVYFQSGAKAGEDSYLTVELSYQHGCVTDELKCIVVFQYMCQPESEGSPTSWQIRDGSTEQTPNFTTPTKFENSNEMSARRQADLTAAADKGQQESWDSYNHCYLRRRNQGLFTADQRLRQNSLGYSSAIYTRQNANGKRHGYECPEERDYYPYWHPSQWKDLAVLTDDPTNDCDYYKSNSFSGTNTRGVCTGKNGIRSVEHLVMETSDNCTAQGYQWATVYNYLEKASQFTDKSSCTSHNARDGSPYIWGVPYDASNFNRAECLVPTPTVDCQQVPWSRMNHLGLDKNTGEFPRYTWTLPYFPSGRTQRCVLRARYNISSGDFDPMTTDYSNNQVLNPGLVTRKYNEIYQAKRKEVLNWGNLTQKAANALIAQYKQESVEDAAQEIADGVSPVRQDPRVKLFSDFPEVRLAINTDQFGRVFQDRSHAFRFAARPTQVPAGAKIYNLNVRGKRGNIVQAYNAVEYDFIPNQLSVTSSDVIHIQWTGSNHQVNDGEGKALTDRSNIVQIAKYSANYPLYGENITMWKNAKVIWTQFQSPNLFPRVDASGSPRSLGSLSGTDPLSIKAKKAQIDNYVRSEIVDDPTQPGNGVPPRLDADAADRPDNEKDMDDGKARYFPVGDMGIMRKRRDVATTSAPTTPQPNTVPTIDIGAGNVRINDQQLGLALMTSGYYWCTTRQGCPSYIPDSYVIERSTYPKMNSTLDEAPASFPGVMVQMKSGTYFYMSTRNNKFTNRSQKGRIIVP